MADADGPTAHTEQPDSNLDAAEVPLQPPPGCTHITPDGGVLKHVVAQGAGDLPVRHGRCLVHYVGRCLPSGEVFMNTKEETQGEDPVVVIAGRDASTRETGLFQAVATMRPGERAWVYITDCKYGYGEKGSFSFPSVPPACQLVYDVTMVACEPPDEERDRRTMLFEERLEAAERRRLEGNALFEQGNYTEALGKYALAISYCDEDFMLQLQGPHLDKAEAVTDPILLNMAAARLKTGEHALAAHFATQIIMRHPRHVKALYRRSKARAGMGRTEEALEDLCKAAEIEPNNAQIQRELRELRATIKEEKAESGKLFKGALGAAPAPRHRPNGSAAAAAAPAAESGGSEISAASAADGAARRGTRSSRREQQRLQLMVALAVLLLAVSAYAMGWLPGM